MVLDFSSNADYIWALLPEILLAIWAMGVLLAGVFTEDNDSDAPGDATTLGWLSLLGLLVVAAANGWVYGAVEGDGSPMIAMDGFRFFANWLLLAGAALTILLSFPYLTRQRLQIGEFYALVLLATLGMMFMASARNLILLFLAIETMSVAAYVLTAFNRRDRKASEAGLKYFLLGAFSSAFLLYGIALVYGGTGTVNLQEIGEAVARGGAFSPLVLGGMALLAIGFAFKVAAVPFHMWTPDVYEGAPTPATAFMSAAVKAASFIAFVRVFMEAFPALHDTWYPVVWWLAALTMIIPNLIALTQTNVKRMLAYSSVAHGGYLLVALAAANHMAMGALLFYLLIYSIMNIGALAVVMVVANHDEEALDLEDYAGFGWKQPVLATAFTVFLLSLAGFPGTAGFMAKIFILQGAVESQLWTLAIILALVTVLSYYYYLRVAWYMWMRPGSSEERHVRVWAPIPMRAGIVGVAALLIFLGIFPGGLLDGALDAVQGLAAGVPAAELVSGLPDSP
ncbi:MAG: NADH-quinone oxidoreductase subunit N [Gemmatimonadales bacterium]|nr:MAG: NADH-quinone oxidoreductase subunit N [Gemmatimonadales bacterium]